MPTRAVFLPPEPIVPDQPNIVFLFPDQLRADFLSCYGANWVETPNMDSIAQNGVRFQNAFSASPICVPARTALLTGMNALRNGVTHNFHNLRAERLLPPHAGQHMDVVDLRAGAQAAEVRHAGARRQVPPLGSTVASEYLWRQVRGTPLEAKLDPYLGPAARALVTKCEQEYPRREPRTLARAWRRITRR